VSVCRRSTVEGTAGQYKVASGGRYAIIACDVATALRLSAMNDLVESILVVEGDMKIDRRLLRSCETGSTNGILVVVAGITQEQYNSVLVQVAQLAETNSWEVRESSEYMINTNLYVTIYAQSCAELM
jgi:hypothetical protein